MIPSITGFLEQDFELEVPFAEEIYRTYPVGHR